jgi:hypothetical protein
MVGANMDHRLTLLLLLPLAAPLAAATQAPKQSWGRPGVSFEQYRRDAVECGRQGYYLDISKTDDAKAFVRGSRELDDATQSASSPPPGANPVDEAVTRANQYERIRTSVQPERRIDHLKTVLQSTVDQCLIQRGYSRFRLTDLQRRQLGKLRLGSAQRQSYLYSLASDPAVLTAQAL